MMKNLWPRVSVSLRSRFVVETAMRQPNQRPRCRLPDLNLEQGLCTVSAELAGCPCLLDETSRIERDESPVVRVALALVHDVEPIRLSDLRIHANRTRRSEPSVEGFGPGRKDRRTSGPQDLLDREPDDASLADVSLKFSPLLLIVHWGLQQSRPRRKHR
jgi:hypothetical protein